MNRSMLVGAVSLALSACGQEADPVECGDGIIGVGETCDDGNTADGDGCSAVCEVEIPASCGNGVVDSGEVCDDGNTANGDGCSSDCRSDETCGNGIVDISAGEGCDHGTSCSDGTSCTMNSECAGIGDGTCIYRPDDSCNANCTMPTCGDGNLDTGEVCDDGKQCSNGASCGSDAPCAGIGDEMCIPRDQDGCNARCTSDETCGNGVVDWNEGCDDNNNSDGDGCSAICEYEYCGNSVVDPGEACDDGNIEAGDGCNADCTSDESCGNGFLDPTETCDDGNTADGDACSSSCRAGIQTMKGGGTHACALLDDGVVKCWGENLDGQLGLGDTNARGDQPGEMGNNLPTIALGTGRMAIAITAGDRHTCALLDNGDVKCWGYNSFDGVLGLGDRTSRGGQPGQMGDNLPAVSLGSGRTAMAVATTDEHTCALLDNGSLKCWGSNDGKLGLGDTNPRGDDPGEMGDSLPAVDLGTGRTAVAIAPGSVHTCALLDDGSVKCWGRGPGLGLGDTNGRGDDPGEMGDNLPVVNLGTGRTALAITAGDNHTCALLDDGTVKCWGGNVSGQLGLGDTDTRGDAPGEMGDDLPVVNLGTGRRAVAIHARWHHTCALLDDRTVKCWGRNGDGTLGLGDGAARGDGPGEMGDNLPAVSLGNGRTSVEIATGPFHSCALLDNASLKCWGANYRGQLGLGDVAARGNDPGEMGDNLPAVDLGL